MKMQHSLLSTTHPEWARMWESLFELAGSYTDHNPVSGEFWQYTGTFSKDRPAIGLLPPTRVLVHQFRHRDRATSCSPISGVANSFGRLVVEVAASLEYSGNWDHGIKEGSLV